jgi:hypothetical protein
MFTLSVLLFLAYLVTLIIATLIAWSNHKKIREEFKPFVLFLVAELCFELASFLFTSNNRELARWINVVQTITGTSLLCWMAVRWQVFDKKNLVLISVIAIAFLVGFAGMFLVAPDLPFWLRITPEIIVIGISIAIMRNALIHHMEAPAQKPMLLIGTGLFVFYTFTTVLVIFARLGNTTDETYLAKIYPLIIPFGVLANVLFIMAARLIPKERALTAA